MSAHVPVRLGALLALITAAAPTLAGAGSDDPFADVVIRYVPGRNAAPGYDDPTTALGPPERFSGEGIDPGVVSMFQAAWRPDELVSIGAGGSLVLRFDTPVTDDPNNPYGIDLLVFSNTFLIGPGVCSPPCGVSDEGGTIEVSPDGAAWTLVPATTIEGLFPTEGWVDLEDPFSAIPGRVPTDPTRPVDPRLALTDLEGLPYPALRDLYHGSAGGAGIDLAPLGLTEIRYVRLSAPIDALGSPEVDAVADVAPRTPGDVDHDGAVGIDDLLALLAAWGPNPPGGIPADFDGDGLVGTADLLALLGHWEATP